MLDNEQTSLITKVALESGFQNFDISVDNGSAKGDNYLGNIFVVTIKEKKSIKEKSLILKCAEANEQVRTAMPIKKCYEREIFIYQKVLPAFVELQDKNSLPHRFEAFAKMYGCSLEDKKEFLLLDNLKALGYGMMNRKLTMDDQHVQLVFKELGKLHSMSFAMKHLQPALYEELSTNLQDHIEESGNVQDVWVQSIKEKFVNCYVAIEGNEEAKIALEKCEKEIGNFFFEELRDKSIALVIGHCDCWCNNMLFKHKVSDNVNHPEKMCFVDWQISKIVSPIIDLSYFFMLSASRDILDNHKKYLSMYHKVIEDNLNTINCDIKKVFPYELLELHWKKYCKFGLFIAVSIMEIIMRDEKDAVTFVDIASEGKSIFQEFLKVSSYTDTYYHRLRDIILFLIENKYL